MISFHEMKIRLQSLIILYVICPYYKNGFKCISEVFITYTPISTEIITLRLNDLSRSKDTLVTTTQFKTMKQNKTTNSEAPLPDLPNHYPFYPAKANDHLVFNTTR